MKRDKLRIIVPIVLCAAFLVAGGWLLTQNLLQMKHYNETIASEKQALVAANPANAETLEGEAAAAQEENTALEETIRVLEEEAAALAEENAQLQDRYDELLQNEDTTYYQTILQSLTEGMTRVEEYINAAE